MRQLGLSARAFHRVQKLARTIADRSAALTAGMAGSETIGVAHPSSFHGRIRAGLAEALQYRPRVTA